MYFGENKNKRSMKQDDKKINAYFKITIMCSYMGHLKIINFPFVPNGKLIIFRLFQMQIHYPYFYVSHILSLLHSERPIALRKPNVLRKAKIACTRLKHITVSLERAHTVTTILLKKCWNIPIFT